MSLPVDQAQLPEPSGLFAGLDWTPNPAPVDTNHPSAQKAINLIKFMMATSVNPQGQNPRRNWTIKFPFDEDAFFHLFPDAVEFKTSSSETQQRVRTTRTHQQVYPSAQDAEHLFGREWYNVHYFNNVGVFVGEVVFTLCRVTNIQFMTQCDKRQVVEIPGTRQTLTVPFLHISFLFAREVRPNMSDMLSDNVDWKLRIEELMARIHPRKLRMRLGDITRSRRPRRLRMALGDK